MFPPQSDPDRCILVNILVFSSLISDPSFVSLFGRENDSDDDDDDDDDDEGSNVGVLMFDSDCNASEFVKDRD